jgi:hypothetical protein
MLLYVKNIKISFQEHKGPFHQNSKYYSEVVPNDSLKPQNELLYPMDHFTTLPASDLMLKHHRPSFFVSLPLMSIVRKMNCRGKLGLVGHDGCAGLTNNKPMYNFVSHSAVNCVKDV